MKSGARARRRSILHVELAPFFVAVERSLDPSLRDVPVVVGGDAHSDGIVAAASEEAHARGVRAGQPLARARQLCPEAAYRRGDLEAYARISDEVTAVLLSASRRVERPSADEAFVDLTQSANPVAAAESIKDALQHRLGLDASLGLGASRVAARVASGAARPRGLLVVLPGYEASFLAAHPVDRLPDLTPQLERALQAQGITTLGQLVGADEAQLTSALGRAAAQRLRAEAQGSEDAPIEMAAPPAVVQEEHTVRDRDADRHALLEIAASLAARAVRRLRPFGLAAHSLSVEVRRADGVERRHIHPLVPLASETPAREVARTLGADLLQPVRGIRSLRVRLGQFQERDDTQPLLFPELPPTAAS